MAKRTSLILMAVVVLAVSCNSVFAFSGAGYGTETYPYVITDVYQLQEMRDDLVAYYILGNDIDASDTMTWNDEAGFEPVGDDVNYFTGQLDGKGYAVMGLYINRPAGKAIGLFGYLRNGAQVKNLGLIDARTWGDYYVGTLAGTSYSNCLIFNCFATGEVTISANGGRDTKSGGLVGSQGYSTISQCISDVNVTALSGRYQVGGLCGG